MILGKETDTPCTTPDNTLDCIPADYYFHTADMVQSDPDDGTLWVSTGRAIRRGSTHSPTGPTTSTRSPAS